MRIEKLKQVESLDEATKLLNASTDNVVLGGGVWLKRSKRHVETAIDLTKLELDYIKVSSSMIKIGAMTTLYQIEHNEHLQKLYDGMFVNALKQIMGVALRNSATIGGSIMGRYAFSDVITPLLTMDTVLVFHQKGEMRLEDYLKEKKIEDILIEIQIKNASGKGFFEKHAHSPLDFSSLNLAITKTQNTYKIAVGSRPSIAKLAKNTAIYLEDSDSIEESLLLETLLNEIKLSSNPRAQESYRALLLKASLFRGLKAVNKR